MLRRMTNFVWTAHGLLIMGMLAVGWYVSAEFKKATKHDECAVQSIIQDIKRPTLHKKVLDNGMTVLVYENRALPKVHIHCAYNIGSAIEGPGERGLAHLIEHMIFKGTQKLRESDIDAIARKYGATYNAQTMHDITSYYFEVDKENWQPFIMLLADCMTNARFDEEHLASEMKAVLAELAMTNDDYWRFMLERSLMALFPANHPYYVPIIGYKEDLVAMNASRLHDFYKKYYVPSRATLFVVGDIDPTQIFDAAATHFGAIESRETVETPQFPPAIYDISTQKINFYRDIEKPYVGFFFHIPGMNDADHIAFEALELLVATNKTSRLSKSLVDEKQCASQVMSGALLLKHEGVFVILVEPHSGKIDEVRSIIIDELQKLAQVGVTKKELATVCNIKCREFLAEQEQFDTLTNNWIQAYMATGDEYAYFNRIHEFAALTQEKVNAVIKKYLDPTLMHEIDILPASADQREKLQKNNEIAALLDATILAKHQRTSPVEEPAFVHTLPNPTQAHATIPLPDTQYALDNGLAVIMHGGADRPFFSLRLSFRDAYQLRKSQQGLLVELLMQMLTEGSDGHTKHELIDFFETHGAQLSVDENGILLEGLVVHAPQLLEKLAHLLLNPRWDAATLEKLKTIAHDKYTRLAALQRESAMRMIYSELYPEHPYCWTYQEAQDAVLKFTQSDIEKLYHDFITPQRMILALAGGFDTNQMKEIVAKVFGSWSGAVYNPRVLRQEPVAIKEKTIDRTMVRDQVFWGIAKPSALTIYHPDMVPLFLLNSISFQGLGSRLYQLREQSGLFYVASGAWSMPATPEHGINVIWTLLAPDKLEEVEKRIRALIQEVAKNGVTENELSAARQLFLKQIIIDSGNMAGLTKRYVDLVSYELPFDFYDQCYARAQSMTCTEMNEIAKRYFTTDGMMRFRVGMINK